MKEHYKSNWAKGTFINGDFHGYWEFYQYGNSKILSNKITIKTFFI